LLLKEAAKTLGFKKFIVTLVFEFKKILNKQNKEKVDMFFRNQNYNLLTKNISNLLKCEVWKLRFQSPKCL